MAEASVSQPTMPRNSQNGQFDGSRNRAIPIGSKFQKLTTVAAPFVRGKHMMVECSCECGGFRIVRAPELVNGKAVGCSECPRVVSEKHRKATADRSRTHGMCRTPEYNLWIGMRERCNNPKNMSYADYGGRGITVCERWMMSFQDFLKDVGMRPSKKHTMDRIDVNGNYEPSNCRWATRLEQARNTRVTFQLEFRGKMMGTAEIARALGVTPAHAWRKLKKQGVSIEEFEAGIINRLKKPACKNKTRAIAPEYSAWRSAKRRCENPKDAAYKEYGGRGISMSEEWSKSYEKFYMDMGPRPDGMSLDRIDNNKGYCLENCRWATTETQNRNRRNNEYYLFRDRYLTKAEIARELGVNPTTVGRYIKRGGMTPDDIERRISARG